MLQKERQVAQLTLSEQAALRQAETATAAQVAEVEAAAAARQREAGARIAELTSRLEAAETSAAGVCLLVFVSTRAVGAAMLQQTQRAFFAGCIPMCAAQPHPWVHLDCSHSCWTDRT